MVHLLGQDLLLGKEVFNFFTKYNTSGILSILFFSILMFLTIWKILNIRLSHKINDYSDFLKLLESKFSFFNYKFFLFIINIFLLISFYIMIVALSTLFHYQFGFEKIIVICFVIVICYYIFSKNNLSFIYILNSVLMPILILFVTFLSLSSINFKNIQLCSSISMSSIFNGLLYFSYNSLLIIPILFKINTKNKKQNCILSFLFSFIILLLTMFINLLLLTFLNDIKDIDLPILAICNFKGTVFSFLYFFIILSAILTTLLSSGFSFIQNIKEKNRKLILIIFLFLSFVFNYFSFSNLIDIFYPLFGLLGFIQIFLILFNKY